MGEIRGLMLAVLLFSGAIAGISLFISDATVRNDKTITDISGLSQAREIEQAAQDLESAAKTKFFGNEILDGFIGTIRGIIPFVDLIRASLFGFFEAAINGISGILPGFIPTWFTGILLAGAALIIIFSIVSVITGRYL